MIAKCPELQAFRAQREKDQMTASAGRQALRQMAKSEKESKAEAEAVPVVPVRLVGGDGLPTVRVKLNGHVMVPILNVMGRATKLPARKQLGTWTPLGADMELLEDRGELVRSRVEQWITGLRASKAMPLPNERDLQLGHLTQSDAELMKKVLRAFPGVVSEAKIGVAEQDRDKTAFVTRQGLFRFRRMPFGLSNAPGTFQRLMDCVLRGLLWVCCLVYLDDIIVFTKGSIERHAVELATVLARLEDHGLSIKIKKCTFAATRLEYLGHELTPHGVQPLQRLVDAVVSFATPTDATAVKRFVHLAGYYRRFVQDFGRKAAPLTQLLRKERAWEWGDAQHRAFECIKQELIQKPLLAYPDFDLPFVLATDASLVGLGAVLQQDQGGGLQPLAYASKVNSETQAKYPITELDRKVRPAKVVPPLRSLQVGAIGDRWALDFAGPLPVTPSGHRYVVALAEYATKWVHGPFRELLTDGAAELQSETMTLDVMCKLEEYLDEDCRQTLQEMCDRLLNDLGVSVSTSSVHRALQGVLYSIKRLRIEKRSVAEQTANGQVSIKVGKDSLDPEVYDFLCTHMLTSCSKDMAFALFHNDDLAGALPDKHPLFRSPLFQHRSLLQDLCGRVTTSTGSQDDSRPASGIPPHCAMLVRLKSLEATVHYMETTIVDRVVSGVTNALEDRTETHHVALQEAISATFDAVGLPALIARLQVTHNPSESPADDGSRTFLYEWGGRFRRVPEHFQLLDGTPRQLWVLWTCGSTKPQLPHIRFVQPCDMGSTNARKRLSDLAFLMRRLEDAARHDLGWSPRNATLADVDVMLSD
ncbi:hypothetical protein P43SY_004345 [Pythium insidiosum]|uniref:Reverse transcriptase domain-containing protein n=1 Tax=Pythium insidiosum TaxID=114742 RepID=A0AAD5Q3Y8_PYTIN|nr:hypothetical protein P43SY_004345 [Pythium insidiosum]